MELFVVKNKSNEVVQGNFPSKKAAKEVRNSLQMASDKGLPKAGTQAKEGTPAQKDERCNHRAWNFRVSLGRDHRLAPVK